MRLDLLNMNDKDPGRADGVIASILVLLTLALLMATLDVGVPRDEGFYFRHAANYQDWFYDVETDLSDEEGSWSSLGREEVAKAWRANAEHPPLAKVLFGASWRLLGHKLRPIDSMRAEGGSDVLKISGVRRSEGFDEGEILWVLGPDQVGSPRSVEERIVGRAQVLGR